MDTYLNIVEKLLQELKDAEKELEGIPSLQSDTDLKISDILHFCENKEKHNAASANRYFKMLGNLRRERRDLKDRYDELVMFVKTGKSIKGYLTSAKISLGQLSKGQSVKTYKVRRLTEEFGEEITRKQ